MTNLQQRLLVGSGSSLFVISLLLYSDQTAVLWLFACTLTTLIALAARELYQASTLRGYAPLAILGIPTCIAYCIATFLSPDALPVQETVLFFFGLLLFAHYMKRGEKPMENMASTLFGVAYLAIPLSLMFPIIQSVPEGKWWLLYLIAITKATDAAAYFAGKAFGKRKLAPVLSPKKTMEGAFIGTAAALVIGALFGYYHSAFSMQKALPASLLLSLLAHFGDLSESLLKRDAGVKDSSHLPGLGGILDMLDSLVFTTPALYLLLRWNLV
jgi:phosphatidate cytidylyltransferase